jgi:hypothetical protein
METTTNMEVNLSDEERYELIENFIPSDSEYLFKDGQWDVELVEIQKAYSNMSDACADRYLHYILLDKVDADQETFVENKTAKAFFESEINYLKSALNDWE